MIDLVFNNVTRLPDLARDDADDSGNISTNAGLEPAVLISLFTRRRAEPDDVSPDPLGGMGGYWADAHPDVPGDLIGSRLWLLNRSKATQSVMNLAKVYAQEALQWMVEDGVADSIEVIVERQNDERLAFQVQIQKPEETAGRWVSTWAVHLGDL